MSGEISLHPVTITPSQLNHQETDVLFERELAHKVYEFLVNKKKK